MAADLPDRDGPDGSDVREQRVTLAGVPALLTMTSDPGRAAERGSVLVLHGFTVDKEAQRTEAVSLARHGYLAVTLDAVGHGERRYPDFAERFAGDDERGDRAFHAIVEAGVAELPAVIAELHARGWAGPGRLGACGISMGGITLFGAITAGCALDAVVTIVATPRWRHVATSPHDQPDRYFPTALMMHTGGDDPTVPPGGARALHEALVPRYAAAPERLRYVEHAGESHLFSEPAWRATWDATLAWYAAFLRA